MLKHQEEKASRGVTLADYQSWRNHPVSRMFQQYLRDFHSSLKEEAWDYLQDRPGVLDSEFLSELAGRAKTCLEIADLPFEAIANYYEGKDATEAVQD